MSGIALRFEALDLVFGPRKAREAALRALDAGEQRDAILERTGALVAVHNAALDVEEGEILVLMGLSGSGKSSLLRCINGLNTATRGRILVHDGGGEIDVAHCDEATLRRLRRERVAMVFQQFALMPWLSVRDNIGFGLEIRGVAPVERKRLVDAQLERVRLEQFAERFPHELSGGMQQRVGLARAFATEASILLMDEPFSALDPLIRAHLQDELIELQRTLKKTIVFVSHDLDEALRIGNRIAIMESGRIMQFGTPEEIVLRPANDTVRRFLGSMNPLSVLTGATLMQPLAQLPRDAQSRVRLDRAGTCHCAVDATEMPRDPVIAGQPASFVAWTPELALDALDGRAIVTGNPRTPMRVAIQVRQQTGRPLVVLREDGALLGVVDENDLYRGMLRQSEHPALVE
jgi:glycine betaine/proline transport system ATP-binding protein